MRALFERYAICILINENDYQFHYNPPHGFVKPGKMPGAYPHKTTDRNSIRKIIQNLNITFLNKLVDCPTSFIKIV
jgi:hypothetical protein